MISLDGKYFNYISGEKIRWKKVKNGLMVTIPGTSERGLVAAAAFGFITGDTKRRFRVIEGLTDKDIIEARRLMEQKKIGLSLKKKVSVWISRSNLLPIRKKLELSF